MVVLTCLVRAIVLSVLESWLRVESSQEDVVNVMGSRQK
jgi:hypothetical protein